MAANDYYNRTATPANNSLPPHPQYPSQNAPDQPSHTQYPSYDTPDQPSHPQYPAHNTHDVPPVSTTPYPASDPFAARPTNASPISPFETPFDDRIYPTGRPPAQPYDSQSTLGQDTRYYGQGGGGRPQDSTGSFRDDIPLTNQPSSVPPKDHYANDQDHVYDAPIRPANLEAGRPNRKSRIPPTPKKSKWKQPWVCYIFGLVQVIVFIIEIVRNAQLTGSPIAIKPNFNFMIGPTPAVQIFLGARYVPCMHKIKGIQGRNEPINWFCPDTKTKAANTCTLTELCGFSGSVGNPAYDGNFEAAPFPNQWYRFIIPIFLHAGVIHIAFNMLLQFTLGREMELAIGSVRFLLVYMASGIFGFVLGGNLASEGIASTGASGALFGVLALVLLDLLYSWKERRSPGKDLAFICLDIAISFVLGLLPGLDNFSHIGGFLMGLVLGICILHSPNALRKRIQEDEPPYTPVAAGYKTSGPGQYAGVMGFAKSPVGFFKERKPAWWAWWLIRVGCLVAVLVVFIVLMNNFYNPNAGKCGWCKYLSCINYKDWCSIGELKFEEISTNTTAKRDVFESWEMVAERVALVF